MKISNPKDIRRIALALDKLANAYQSNINVVRKTIDPQAPEKELIETLIHYEKEKIEVVRLREAAFINIETMAIHEKAAS